MISTPDIITDSLFVVINAFDAFLGVSRLGTILLQICKLNSWSVFYTASCHPGTAKQIL